MKTRITALILSLVMALSLVAFPAFADTAAELKSDIVLTEGTVGGKDGLYLDWYITTGSGGIITANIALAYDKTVFDLVDKDGNVLAFPDTDPPVLNAAQLVSCDFELFNDLYARDGEDNTAILAIVRSAFFNPKIYTTPTSVCQIFLAYKDGKDISDVTANAIRYATPAEAWVVAQSSVVGMGDGVDFTEYKYGTDDDTDTPGWGDSLTFAEDFDFAEEGVSYEVGLNTVNGAQMRTTGKQGLRFTSSIAKTGDFASVKEYGTLLIPTENVATIDDVVIGATLDGRAVLKVPAVYKYAEDDDKVTYTAVITDIAEKNYERAYTARAYAIMNDDTVIYGETSTSRSIYQIAKLILADSAASATDKAAAQAIVDVVEVYGDNDASFPW